MRWKTLAVALGLLGVLALSACGATTTPLGGAPSATSTSSSSSALISTRSDSVKGTTETVLTNAQGMTLYYFDKDTSTSVACTGNCVSFWPPLLAPNGAAPTSSASLPGGLSLLNGTNGHQVMYNGHPLYTFSGDKSAGDTNGEGIMGLWHVATPDLMPASAPTSPTATPSSGGGGYGGGGY
jgi:predicted lipoprotein with Yx(FWY)xxD motif